MEGYAIATFCSTHSAILAEQQLRGRLPFQVMPTPRCVTASCGISLRFSPALAEEFRAALTALPTLKDCWAIYRVQQEQATPL